jgi:hypothetical protein
VVGLDFSRAFVDAADSMRRDGAAPYRRAPWPLTARARRSL